MSISINKKQAVAGVVAGLLIISNLLAGRAAAANFTMQTGYYIGNGGTQTVSGLGFQPQLVIIKSDTSAGQAVWKSSAMPTTTTAFFSAAANDTATMVTLGSDGFSVATNANVNTANVRYSWTAFTGSDCTASGSVCIGSYTGNGTNPRLITTGFQPAFAMVKIATATTAANFRTTPMATNEGNYFTTTARNTAGALFTTLAANGFNVGTTNNTSGQTFYYVAFKAAANVMAVGSYSGDATGNRTITGFGISAAPNFVIVKNATSVTTANRNPVMNNTHTYGDYSSTISTATANASTLVQTLQTDGFRVGANVQVNESAATLYWAAWGGAAAMPSGSGTFKMATGSYTGNGTTQTISGVGFTPDLVVIKDNAAQQSVFRTSLMAANDTAFLAAATANFANGITTLNVDGFSVGGNTTVNTSGDTYHWQAYGGAYNPTTRSGATDFMVGAYTGNGGDNRAIADTPTQPDMVAVKRSGATAGIWRSIANTGDSSSFFGATAESADRIQALQTNGFQVGTQANTAGNLHNWFAFKTGDNFAVGTYTGTGGAQTITSPGFQPDLAWVKRSTAVNGMLRGSSLAGDSTQYFANVANAPSRITGLVCNGFSLTSTSTETNASGGAYRYAVWRVPTSVLGIDIVDSSGCTVSSPGVSLSPVNASFACSTATGTLGVPAQQLRITNTTATPGWVLSIAATGGANALWTNGGSTYDFNDGAGATAGCSDGVDADSGQAGQLTLNPSDGMVTPKSGCTTAGVSLGSSAAFQQSTQDSLTVAAASSANTNCYWNIAGIGVSQKIPPEATAGSYTLNLTATIVAN